VEKWDGGEEWCTEAESLARKERREETTKKNGSLYFVDDEKKKRRRRIKEGSGEVEKVHYCAPL